jgi:hypothetical protein
MYLKCRRLTSFAGPSEEIVEVTTLNGVVELIVDTDLLRGEFLNIGPVVARRQDKTLIELPRETVSGQTRVWVSTQELSEAEDCRVPA